MLSRVLAVIAGAAVLSSCAGPESKPPESAPVRAAASTPSLVGAWEVTSSRARGVGKNLLMNYYFAKVQEIYGEDTAIFMACLEFRYDKSFARKCGLKVAYSPYEVEVEQRRRHKLGQAG